MSAAQTPIRPRCVCHSFKGMLTQRMSAIKRLPSEIRRNIADQLDTDADRRSLALVSHEWSAPAQHSLFAVIDVQCDSQRSDELWAALVKVLRERADLAGAVRALNCLDGREEETQVGAVFRLCGQIQRFRARYTYLARDATQYSIVLPPSLVALDLTDPNIDQLLVSCCMLLGLRSLRLAGSTIGKLVRNCQLVDCRALAANLIQLELDLPVLGDPIREQYTRSRIPDLSDCHGRRCERCDGLESGRGADQQCTEAQAAQDGQHAGLMDEHGLASRQH